MSRAHYGSSLHASQPHQSRSTPTGPAAGTGSGRSRNSEQPISRSSATPAAAATRKQATGPHAAVKNLNLQVAEGHAANIKSVAWNSTGSRVATGSSDRTARVWFPEKLPDTRSRAGGARPTGYTWELRGHAGAVEQVSWDPTHADRLATASQDRTLRVWEYRMLRQLLSLDLGSAVLHVAYAPDGKRLAAGTKDERICVVDVAAGQVVHAWHETRTSVHQLVWSHSGELLCLSTQQGTVKIVETRTWRLLHEIEGNTSSVFCLEFDPLGRYLAVGGADAIVSLWDLEDWICVRTFNALTMPIRSLSFSHDGTYLAAGSEDALIDISEVETGIQVHTIPVTAATNAVAWHPNKLSLAVASEDKVLRLYH